MDFKKVADMVYNVSGHNIYFTDVAILGRLCISVREDIVSKQGCPILI